MLRKPVLRRIIYTLALAVLVNASPAAAGQASTGGVQATLHPKVTKFICQTGDQAQCSQGQVLSVRGEGLADARSVVFLGAAGRADDQVAAPDERSPHRVLVRVPTAARSGRVRIVSVAGAPSPPSRALRVLPAPPPPPPPLLGPGGEGVFPVRGAYDFGTTTNGFGGGRGHKGQDVLAACGTPLVAVYSGVVTFVRFQSRAGNYVVITADDATSQAYMHLLNPAAVTQGTRVSAGQQLGQVGRTGRASACHLHFELWTAPGWYLGGAPIDPLPWLQSWAVRG